VVADDPADQTDRAPAAVALRIGRQPAQASSDGLGVEETLASRTYEADPSVKVPKHGLREREKIYDISFIIG